jgi:hypothetical protein
MGLDSFRPQGLEAADPWTKETKDEAQGRTRRELSVCVAHEHCIVTSISGCRLLAGICCDMSTYHIASPLGEREHAYGSHKKLKRENAASYCPRTATMQGRGS